MTRKSPPQPVKLPHSRSSSEQQSDILVTPNTATLPLSPRLNLSATKSTFKFNSKKGQGQAQTAALSKQQSMPLADLTQHYPNSSPLQTAVSFSTSPHSSADSERRERPTRASFFNNYMATRSVNRLPTENSNKISGTVSTGGGGINNYNSKDLDRTGPGSSLQPIKDYFTSDTNSAFAELSFDFHAESSPPPPPPPPSPPPPPPIIHSNPLKKNKPRYKTSRSTSTRDDLGLHNTESFVFEMSSETEKLQSHSELALTTTPPVEQERSYRSFMVSNIRQHSSERISAFSRERSKESKNRNTKESSASKSQASSTNQKEHNRNISSVASGSANSFINQLKNQASKGANSISKNLFGKNNRSTNTVVEKPPVEIDDENYELKVINLPLVQQTRLTRISKKLEDSRDKTEFWMPAFPWRAIDYLNYKGSDVEGLYRVPGSGPEIKKWRRRFDQELDIDLFQQHDLYDINIIGSLLKAWFRELPDELLPKAAQERIARECASSEKVPQLLVDELSNLSPFNYYLLFAITCHLSLLLAHSDKNKMDYRNLCICFQPCMKIDALCFRFLVCDWRDCWKGCKTESFYIEQEYMLFDQAQLNIRPLLASYSCKSQAEHERNTSSSPSSKSSSVNGEPNSHQSQKKVIRAQLPHRSHTTPPAQNNVRETKGKNGARSGSLSSSIPPTRAQIVGSRSSNSISLTSPIVITDQNMSPGKKSEDIRPLSPIKPLSPMGF